MNIDFKLLEKQIDEASDLLSNIATVDESTEHEIALLSLIQLAESLLALHKQYVFNPLIVEINT